MFKMYLQLPRKEYGKTTPQRFDEALETGMSRTKAKLDEFVADMQSNPARALEWGDVAFEATAKYGAYLYISHVRCALRDYVRSGEKTEASAWAELSVIVTHGVTTRALTPESSTSACSNLLDRHKLAAWAELADVIEMLGRVD